MKKGFTLVEVMIGMMILVVAVVTATSLLINIMNSNKMIANHLKGYYLAQEGIEAVRNIRDTRWLNNKDWLGGGIYEPFETDGPVYSLGLRNEGWSLSPANQTGPLSDLNALGTYYPWNFKKHSAFDYENEFVVKNVDNKNFYPEFYRYIEFKKYESPECDKKNDPVLQEECNSNFILAKSIVKWNDLGREYNVTLEEVLSSWKGGAL